MVKRFLFLCVAALLLLPAGGLAGPQVGQGEIKGRMTDSQGNGVPGTTVVFRNVTTGKEYQATTDQNGDYSIAGVETGRYTLQTQTAQIITGTQITVDPTVTYTVMIVQVANLSLMGTVTYARVPRIPMFSAIDTGMNASSLGSGVFINPNGTVGVGSGVTPLTNSSGQVVAFMATNPNAQIVAGAPGTFSTAQPTMRLGDTRNVDRL